MWICGKIVGLTSDACGLSKAKAPCPVPLSHGRGELGEPGVDGGKGWRGISYNAAKTIAYPWLLTWPHLGRLRSKRLTSDACGLSKAKAPCPNPLSHGRGELEDPSVDGGKGWRSSSYGAGKAIAYPWLLTWPHLGRLRFEQGQSALPCSCFCTGQHRR